VTGYYQESNGVCHICNSPNSNCLQCSSATNCSLCTVGYATPLCNSCTTGYYEASANPVTCTICTQTNDKCLECTSPAQCSRCTIGYAVPACTECASEYTGTGCSDCASGFYRNTTSGTCNPCTEVNINCDVCAVISACTTCA
jgi:hypothetical protein